MLCYIFIINVCVCELNTVTVSFIFDSDVGSTERVRFCFIVVNEFLFISILDLKKSLNVGFLML